MRRMMMAVFRLFPVNQMAGERIMTNHHLKDYLRFKSHLL
jgi:hypothetical protein